MCKKSLLMMLLMALLVPWAANAQNSIPFNEGFESMTSVDDLTAAGWTLSTTESGTFLAIETGASNVYEGSKSLNLDAWNASSSSSVQYLGLPLVAGDLNTLQISFAYKVTSGTINVGYLTDATDFSTFTSLAQYSASSSFVVKTTDLSEAPGDAARLVIKYTGWYRLYLDSFEVKTLPSCEAATSITASDITATSATIAWEGEGNNWNLDYNGTVVNNISAMTYNLTGLTDGTNYTVKVQNVCDDGTTTDWVSTTFRTLELCPEGMVCIGEGTATNGYLPTYFFYNYSLTEQIYTADEIGTAGAIESVDIYSVGTGTRTLEIYMVSTEKRSFEDGDDWISATASDLVFSGEVTFAANSWNTFEFDNPFIYNGTSNVALIVRDMTGSYVSGIQFFVFEAESQALYAYRDASEYDLAAPGVTGTVLSVKNRVRFAIGEPPACPKPTGLAVNYEGGTSATFTWTENGTATSWDFQYSTDAEFNDYTSAQVDGTPSFELTGLELATTYYVRVNAFCEAPSEYSTTISFRTDNCMPEDMCAISFSLVDSYGDGWNGAAIQVYDYDTITDELTLLGEYTVPSSSSSANYTLNVCDGRYLVFFWSSGSYDSECSYAVYDNLGDPIFSGSGAMSDYELFFMNCNSTCRMPRNFAASEITGHEVTLSWTELGEATSWTLAYMAETDTVVSYIEDITTNPYLLEGLEPQTKYYAMISPNCEDQYKWSETITWTTTDACPKPVITVVPTPTSAEVSWTGLADEYTFEWAQVPAAEAKDALWLQYDDDTYVGGIGNSSANTWTWGVMYPADMLEGNGLVSKVSIYETSYNTEDITINIYSGGDDAPGELVYTETVTPEGAGAFHEITLSEVVTVDPTQNLWITLTEYGTYVMPYCQNGDNANNDWVLNGSTWAHIGDLASSLAGDTWMIRGYVEPAYDPTAIDWQVVSGATSPVTLDNLEPNTTYIVRIKALCGGEDGESEWATITFITPDACTTPFDLAANDITATSANLSWTGYQEYYNLRYRQTVEVDPSTPATIILEAHDVWGDGSGYQMLFDADATAYGVLWNENHYIFVDGEQYTGGDLPTEYYDEFEYMIPAGANGALDDTINVVVDDIVTITIPAGTYDYVILNPTPGDRFYIAADNGEVPCAGNDYVFEPGVTYHFTMQRFGSGDGAAFEVIRDWTDWTTVENVTNPYNFTNLIPETTYEWQVQGVNCDGEGNNTEWSEMATFTTLEQTTVMQTVALAAGKNWFSTYVEITLADLQNALVAALPGTAITIASQSDGKTTYNGSRWRGQLTSLDVTKMYKIEVTADCEIVLEGMPLNPADHPVTIYNGANWIGFPFSTSMTVADAFAGFAVNGDAVSAQLKSTTYNGTRWRGSLTTLEPGQGYNYKSAATEERTFVYPVATSKAAPTNLQNPVTKVTSAIERKAIIKTIDIDIIK